MAKNWKVNHLGVENDTKSSIQIFIGDKRYESGDSFSATEVEVDASGARPYVTETQAKPQARSQAAPKPADKKVEAPAARSK